MLRKLLVVSTLLAAIQLAACGSSSSPENLANGAITTAPVGTNPSDPSQGTSPSAPAASITQLEISPVNASMVMGEQYPYLATAIFSDGHTEDYTTQVQWASSGANSATASNSPGSQGLLTAGSVPATVNVTATLGMLSAMTPLNITLPTATPSLPGQADFPVKEVDLVGATTPIYGASDYRTAASNVFSGIFQPYYLATSDAARAAILTRIAFSCAELTDDPSNPGHSLQFPFDLYPQKPGALLWHRYGCTFLLKYTDATGTAVNYTSPAYTVHQLDSRYDLVDTQPGVAFQNYNFGTDSAPQYSLLGLYVQSLDKLLRTSNDAAPATVFAGVNGGYDYRVDAWSSSTSDNICPPRSAPADKSNFYTHPAPAQCPQGSDEMPSCATGTELPYTDDLGDSLVYLPSQVSARSTRGIPFQSFSCGGLSEAYSRGAVAFYGDDIYTLRTSANRGDLSELLHNGERAISALGAGPLLIRDGLFVYNEANSEEGMPIDNYELGGATGVGYERAADRSLHVHIVNIEGHDNTNGLHDWMLGLYFLSTYAHSDGALTLGNGGDATMWINPQGDAVKAVLAAPAHPNHGYFDTVFNQNNNPGVISNCDFAQRPLGCSARPVHDGLFMVMKGN